MLELQGVSAGYGPVQVLRDVSLTVEEGEVVGLVGANGAGKSTTLRTISGLIRPTRGRITYEGRDLTVLPPELIVAMGIAHVPEGRRVFPLMSVLENLELGAYVRSDAAGVRDDLDRVFTLFPRLAERRTQLAGTLSGGEQQMLAIGRALMTKPKMLCIDEPSIGLSPKVREEVFEAIAQIREREGIAILLVEQEVTRAFDLANRAYVLSQGRVVAEGEPDALTEDETLRESYLGI